MTIRRARSASLRFIAFTAFWLAPPCLCSAATLLVPQDFPTIAAACAIAVAGDSVVVACGEYDEHQIVVPAGVTLRGQDPTATCVTIDGEDLGEVIRVVPGDETKLEGLRIIRGNSVLGGGVHAAYASLLRVTSCKFEQNRAFSESMTSGDGGAINSNGFVSIDGCLFTGNQAGHGGGAVATSTYGHVEIRNSRFIGNAAPEGGAIMIPGGPLIPAIVDDCAFLENSATAEGGAAWLGKCSVSNCSFSRNFSDRFGGAVATLGGLTMNETLFLENTARHSGGAIGILGEGDGALPLSTFEGCAFERNSADIAGGAISAGENGRFQCFASVFEGNGAPSGGAVFVEQGTALLSTCRLFDNIATIRGGALDGDGSITFSQCTITRNSAPNAGGIYFRGFYPFEALRIQHSLVSHSLEGEAVLLAPSSWIQMVQCTDIFGNAGGDWTGYLSYFADSDGNFSLDPQYCDPANDDFGLQANSPCAPENSGSCGLVGALPVACGTVSVRESSWGSIKGRYR